MESGNLHQQFSLDATASDATGGPVVASRSHKNPRVKTTKANLPLLIQNDPDDKWSKNVLPSVILWYGDQGNVWSIKESELERVLTAIIDVVYPSFDEIDEMKQGGHIYNLVRTTTMFIYTSLAIVGDPTGCSDRKSTRLNSSHRP